MLKKDEVSDPNSCLNKATDDMPIFVLKAADLIAVKALSAWIAEATRLQVNQAKITGACSALEKFLAWQGENPERTKIPD